LAFCNSKSNIAKLGKCFHASEPLALNEDAQIQDIVKKSPSPFAVFTLFQDNSTQIQDPKTCTTLSTIYPPPTAKAVMFIEYCIPLERIFILLTSGTLCVYRIDRETAILEKL